MAKLKNKKKVSELKLDKNSGLQQRLLEVFFIVSLVCSVYLLLSLWTFSLSSIEGFKATGPLYNAGGRAGAYVSKYFFYTLGYSSYLLPFALSYAAFLLLKSWETLQDKWLSIVVNFIGVCFIILSLCGISSLIGLTFTQHLPKTGGGLIGLFIAKGLFSAFSLVGSLIILLGLSLMGLTLITKVSWLTFVESIGCMVSFIFAYLSSKLLLFRRFLSQLFNKIKFSKLFSPKPKSIQTPIIPMSPAPKLDNLKITPKTRIAEPVEPLVDERLEEEVAAFSKDDFFGTPPEKPTKIQVSERYQKDKQQTLFKNKSQGTLPSLSLLSKAKTSQTKRVTHEELERQSRDVEQKLLDFGVEVKVVAVHPGPVITRYELQLAAGLKVSKITALGKDLARSLSVTGVRVVEVIPGKSVVGLELPNEHRDMVVLSEVLSSDVYEKSSSHLTLALGVDIAGMPMVVDLAKMPHLLVAGTTGSGKSVGINAMLISLLFKATPEEVRLIMVDPKMLELSVYDGIPHLLTPVVTDMKNAARALRWCVMEMERRYKLMASLGVRNISGFNKKVKEALTQGEPIKDPLWQGLEAENAPNLTTLPSIVVVIDELADMMMVVGKKVEQLIARIAQKARAAGIHLILATQRPSVDVLTGLIKSNIPTRIAFQVSSKIDSRTILDQGGADQLLGHGDMLYLAPGSGAPIRVHGAFVDDNEVHRIASAWRELGEPDYIEDIMNVGSDTDEFSAEGAENKNETDALYDEAIEFVTQARKASISSVQRRFKIGYNRAARLVEEMERTGVVGPMEGGSREVLAPPPPTGDN